MSQSTNTIVMIRPICFRGNEQTRVNNHYQTDEDNLSDDTINHKAQQEFDTLAVLLQNNGVNVIVVNDTDEFDTPDSIFPNNWISFHENGTVAVYPMFAENRRNERREDVLEEVEKHGFVINDVIDYSAAEDEAVFLEGTGSMVLDRVNKKAYCALSPRSDEDLFIEFCEDFEYTPVLFNAAQTINDKRKAIYHTNVMMCIADDFAVICLDAIDDKKERKNVVTHLKTSGKKVITISEDQVNAFAGNMLLVNGTAAKKFLVMSTSAYSSLTDQQITDITLHCDILHSDLTTIETQGGGSARCMLAEVFLPIQ